MIYNEEQWKVIANAAPHFETARRDYIRNVPRWLSEQIISVYEDATGKTIMSKDLNCAVCVLHIYQTIGKTYFTDLDERNKLAKDKENEKGNDNKKNAETNDGNEKKKKRSTKKV